MSTPTDPYNETQASTSPPTSSVQESPSASTSRKLRSNLLIIAYSAILLILFCIIGFIPYSKTFLDSIQHMFQRTSLPSTPAETPLAVASLTAPIADTTSTCVIIWVKHQPDDLGKKSRAKVWEQKVSDEVKAAGLTPHKFYDQVVEHNPQLIQDDYEFKKGKTYFLPECQ